MIAIVVTASHLHGAGNKAPSPVENRAAGICWIDSVDAAWKTAKERDGLLLLFITSKNCLYCKKMQRTTYADPEVVRLIGDHYVAVTARADNIPELVKKLKVRTYPTTLIISPGAQVLATMPGYVSADKLCERLESATDKARIAAKP